MREFRFLLCLDHPHKLSVAFYCYLDLETWLDLVTLPSFHVVFCWNMNWTKKNIRRASNKRILNQKFVVFFLKREIFFVFISIDVNCFRFGSFCTVMVEEQEMIWCKLNNHVILVGIVFDFAANLVWKFWDVNDS